MYCVHPPPLAVDREKTCFYLMSNTSKGRFDLKDI